MRDKDQLSKAMKEAAEVKTIKRLEDFPFGNILGMIGKAVLDEFGWYAFVQDGRKVVYIIK